jgi:hypothetical protein
MEKIDARTLKDEALHERRRQVIRLHKRGGSPTQIAQVSELSYPAVRKIIQLYETGGTAGIKPGKRGRRAGEGAPVPKAEKFTGVMRRHWLIPMYAGVVLRLREKRRWPMHPVRGSGCR